jgi:hypothetical protein
MRQTADICNKRTFGRRRVRVGLVRHAAVCRGARDGRQGNGGRVGGLKDSVDCEADRWQTSSESAALIKSDKGGRYCEFFDDFQPLLYVLL